MLAHRLDPVQPQRVQHRTRTLHHTQDKHRQREPKVECGDNHDDAQRGPDLGEGGGERHFPEHDGQLLVGEREGPETEVGSRVGNAVEAEFCAPRLA